MTEQELKDVFNEPGLIAHENMRDVAFYPTGIEIEKDVYKLSGLWYNRHLKGFMALSNGEPVRETIKIKKEDLIKWKMIEHRD